MFQIPVSREDISQTITDRQRMADLRQNVRNAFSECFNRAGFLKREPASLIPEEDESVLFTGAPANTFKPYIMGKKIDEKLYIIQPCLRTRNLKTLQTDERVPKWASYFNIIGALVEPQHLNELSHLSWVFFTQYLKIPPERLKVRIASKDTDLHNYWKEAAVENCLEIDKEIPAYYTHRYGVEGVSGRNYNMAAASFADEPARDMGNIIVIERGTEPVAAEIGFGVETFISNILGLPSAIQASVIADVMPTENGASIRLADALAASIAILDTGVVSPRGQKGDHRGRILKHYLQTIIALRKETGFSSQRIREFAEAFELREYGQVSMIPQSIEQYIETHDLLQKSDHTDHTRNSRMAEVIHPLARSGHTPRKPLSCLCEP